MSITVKLIPTKQLFINPSTGYRVLSCVLVKENPEIELNNYGNFTLSGDNLKDFSLDTEYELEISKDEKSKYSASYKLVNYAGVVYSSNGIKIKPEQEILFLRQIADGKQPDYIHAAYPSFVQMILDGREEEIDLKKIHNVGKVRFELYIQKIKERLQTIKFMSITSEWQINDYDDIKKLSNCFKTPKELEEELKTNPYHVFFDFLQFSFTKTDRYVLSHSPELINSKQRCEYACLEILRQNELEGDTRLYDELLVEMVEEIAPEIILHIDKVLQNSDKIYYDKEKGYVSKQITYEAELNIATHIKNRLKSPNFFEGKEVPDFEKYRSIEGFSCTDEQMQTLKTLWDKNILMLNAPAGAGKTSSMKSAIKMLEDNNIDYLLLAPTGIAMKRLKESTGRPASTIHMALACDIPTDFEGVLVIEEASMVSVHLLSTLLTAIGNKCKILFICDEAQLASISCGNVVQDIIDSGIVPLTRLTKVFRYGTSGLATIATDTRNGYLGARLENIFSDYTFIPINNNPIEQVLNAYNKLLDNYSKDDIIILSPYNKGGAGTYVINNEIQARYNPNPETNMIRKMPMGITIMFKKGDRVVNTHNEYQMPCFEIMDDGSLEHSIKTIQVMNGDIGIVREVKKLESGSEELVVEFDTGLACVSGKILNNLLLGYSISVHKSQGSQAKAVITLFDSSHARLLTRNLMYVADSRAQKELIEIGDIEAIKKGLGEVENKQRDTWLCELLR